jgi:hypothetical protein
MRGVTLVRAAKRRRHRTRRRRTPLRVSLMNPLGDRRVWRVSITHARRTFYFNYTDEILMSNK